MKITYCITPNDSIEIEVTDEVAFLLEESYRKEENGERKNRRHQQISIDALEWDELEIASNDTPESVLLEAEAEAESNDRYAKALALLTEVQRNRFLMYASGLSTSEIARREGTAQRSVYESIEAARKKLKKFYETTL